jgi:hypothetical protein
MEKQLFQLAAGVVALSVGIYFARKHRHQVREKVSEWLRNNNLEKSALQDVVTVYDSIAGAIEKNIVCKIFVKTQAKGETKISEVTYTMEELKKIDPDLYAEVEKLGHAQKSILTQIN